jgi:hypothetical protein
MTTTSTHSETGAVARRENPGLAVAGLIFSAIGLLAAAIGIVQLAILSSVVGIGCSIGALVLAERRGQSKTLAYVGLLLPLLTIAVAITVSYIGNR